MPLPTEMHIGRSNEIQHVTYFEFNEDTENLGAALTELGFGSSHIACMSENRYEWIVAFLTVLKSAGVFVPVDKELPTADKINVLTESESKVLFFSSRYAKWVTEHKADLPGISLFICFDAQKTDPEVKDFRELINHGASLSRAEYDSLHSDEYELKLLVYTSGTTGIAKGVMLTEHNICSLIYYGFEVTEIYDKGLSVLPYHHTYEAVTDILPSIRFHSTLCINASLKDIVKDLQLFQPSYIYIVPALAEFMISSIQKNIKKQGKDKVFQAAAQLSKRLRSIGIDMRPYLFQSVRNVFGGRMRKIICGGAPIRPELGEFFDTIGIYLIGGYGITECSPLVSVNDEKTVTYDTVGHWVALNGGSILLMKRESERSASKAIPSCLAITKSLKKPQKLLLTVGSILATTVSSIKKISSSSPEGRRTLLFSTMEKMCIRKKSSDTS